MKIFIGIIFVLLSTYLGYLASNKYIVKRRFYQSFYDFNKIMQNEVAFSKNSLIEILNKNANLPFFSYVKNNVILKNKIVLDKNFSDDEKVFIKNYVENLGNSDSVTQISYLNSVDENIKKQLDECIANEKKYKSLYIKLGFLLGAVVLIILL